MYIPWTHSTKWEQGENIINDRLKKIKAYIEKAQETPCYSHK